MCEGEGRKGGDEEPETKRARRDQLLQGTLGNCSLESRAAMLARKDALEIQGDWQNISTTLATNQSKMDQNMEQLNASIRATQRRHSFLRIPTRGILGGNHELLQCCAKEHGIPILGLESVSKAIRTHGCQDPERDGWDPGGTGETACRERQRNPNDDLRIAYNEGGPAGKGSF